MALATFVLGVLLVILGDWSLVTDEWLTASIILFAVTVVDAQFVTLPTVAKLADLTASEDGASSELSRLVRKVRIGGTLSAVLLAVITLLMVWKPGS